MSTIFYNRQTILISYEICNESNHQIKHTYTNRPKSDTISKNAKGGGYGDRTGRSFVSQKIYGQQTERTEKKYIFPNWYCAVKINADYPP